MMICCRFHLKHIFDVFLMYLAYKIPSEVEYICVGSDISQFTLYYK